MLRLTSLFLLLVATATFAAAPAQALTFPFTEDFATDSANWKNAQNLDVTWNATGGPDGVSDSYISTVFTTSASTSAVTVFRAQNNFTPPSSGGAFIGNWESAGVTAFSFWIRHNASESLTLGTRFATQNNSPAWAALTDTLVPPNEWTEVIFGVYPGSPDLEPEGNVTYSQVFSTIGRLQIAMQRGGVPASTPITFDIDKVSIVPEPSTFAMAGCALVAAGAAAWSRRRKAARA